MCWFGGTRPIQRYWPEVGWQTAPVLPTWPLTINQHLCVNVNVQSPESSVEPTQRQTDTLEHGSSDWQIIQLALSWAASFQLNLSPVRRAWMQSLNSFWPTACRDSQTLRHIQVRLNIILGTILARERELTGGGVEERRKASRTSLWWRNQQLFCRESPQNEQKKRIVVCTLHVIYNIQICNNDGGMGGITLIQHQYAVTHPCLALDHHGTEGWALRGSDGHHLVGMCTKGPKGRNRRKPSHTALLREILVNGLVTQWSTDEFIQAEMWN